MKAVVYRGKGDIRVEELPVPEPGPGEMLVRVDACGICPTDLKKIESGLLPGPRVFGHETAGTVAKLGQGVSRYREGERVVVHHHVPCGSCYYCERKAFAQCPVYKKNGTTAGFEPSGGGYAEYVLALLGMLAYERPADAALVLAAGVSEAWLDAGGVAVEGLPTWWGPLHYTLKRLGPEALELELGPGLRLPPGGIVFQPPLARCDRRLGRPARHRRHGGAPDQLDKAGAGVLAVALLRAMPLRRDDEHALDGQPPSGQPFQPLAHLRRQRS